MVQTWRIDCGESADRLGFSFGLISIDGSAKKKIIEFKYVICAVSFNLKIICTICC